LYAEPTETFEVRLVDLEGATRSDGIGVVTITDPDVCTDVIGPTAPVLNGTAGDDVLCGDGRGNRINGLEGNDTVLAGDGVDVVDSGPGNDTLRGEAGDDH